MIPTLNIRTAAHIQQKKNIEGKWYQVPTIRELEVPADELILLPSDSNEMDITWDYYYGKLDDGKVSFNNKNRSIYFSS